MPSGENEERSEEDSSEERKETHVRVRVEIESCFLVQRDSESRVGFPVLLERENLKRKEKIKIQILMEFILICLLCVVSGLSSS